MGASRITLGLIRRVRQGGQNGVRPIPFSFIDLGCANEIFFWLIHQARMRILKWVLAHSSIDSMSAWNGLFLFPWTSYWTLHIVLDYKYPSWIDLMSAELIRTILPKGPKLPITTCSAPWHLILTLDSCSSRYAL